LIFTEVAEKFQHVKTQLIFTEVAEKFEHVKTQLIFTGAAVVEAEYLLV
jgi:hypothetical protein